jgi:hypothetical protein
VPQTRFQYKDRLINAVYGNVIVYSGSYAKHKKTFYEQNTVLLYIQLCDTFMHHSSLKNFILSSDGITAVPMLWSSPRPNIQREMRFYFQGKAVGA